MDIAMIGLGKMGANMAARLLAGGHRVVGYDLNEAAIKAIEEQGAVGARTLEEVAKQLPTPRVVWIMVPSGKPTEDTINGMTAHLAPGDILIDGGNSNYKDSMRRAAAVAEKGVAYVDVGTSGGVWGLTEGYCMMIGGEKAVVESLRPLFATLAPGPDQGWGHVGAVGAGHFVKMVHNGIEYGIMQAYAEGFELMRCKTEMALDVHQIAEIWRYGSVVRSWLLDLAAKALAENPTLADIAAYVPDSGEGRWTVVEAIDLAISIPVITAALQARFRSRDAEPFSDKLLASLRNQFGGHAVKHTETGQTENS